MEGNNTSQYSPALGALKRLLRGLVAAGLGALGPVLVEYLSADHLEPVLGATWATAVTAALLALDKYVRATHGSWGGLFGR